MFARGIASMSRRFSPRTIMLMWLVVVLGLFAALEAPMSFATGVLMFLVWGLVPATMFLVWHRLSPTMAEVQHQVETRSDTGR